MPNTISCEDQSTPDQECELTGVGKELAPYASSSSLPNQITKWAEYPLSESKVDCIRDRASHLSSFYRIPMPAATSICCAAVTAAIGSSFTLQGPGQLVTKPGTHTLLVSPSPTPMRLATLDAFLPIIRMVDDRVGRQIQSREEYGESFAEARHYQISEKFKVAKKLQESVEEMRQRDFTDGENTRNLAKEEREAAKMREQAIQETSALREEQHPFILLENPGPATLLKLARPTLDYSTLALDPYGSLWSALCCEKPAMVKDVANLLARGWSGSPGFHKGRVEPGRSLSSIFIAEPAQLRKLMGNKVLGNTGLRRMLFIPLCVPSPPIDDEPLTNGNVIESFAKLLEIRVKLREAEEKTIVSLTDGAVDVYMDFVADISMAESNNAFITPEPLKGAAENALKIALALVAGKCVFQEQLEAVDLLGIRPGVIRHQELDEVTMRQACSLVASGIIGCYDTMASDREYDRVEYDEIEDEMLAMVVRVKRKGKLTKRELARSYHDQRKEKLQPIWEAAIARGLLIEDEAGQLTTPG